MFIVFYTVKIVYICVVITFSASDCLCDTRIHRVCVLVPIRQHGVITQTTTIGTFTSTKTSNPMYHIVLITLLKASPGALQMS